MKTAIDRGSEDARKQLRGPLLVASESETDNPASPVLERGSKRAHRDFLRLAAAMIDDDSAFDAVSFASELKSVEQRRDWRVPITEPDAVGSQRERYFEVAKTPRRHADDKARSRQARSPTPCKGKDESHGLRRENLRNPERYSLPREERQEDERRCPQPAGAEFRSESRIQDGRGDPPSAVF